MEKKKRKLITYSSFFKRTIIGPHQVPFLLSCVRFLCSSTYVVLERLQRGLVHRISGCGSISRGTNHLERVYDGPIRSLSLHEGLPVFFFYLLCICQSRGGGRGSLFDAIGAVFLLLLLLAGRPGCNLAQLCNPSVSLSVPRLHRCKTGGTRFLVVWHPRNFPVSLHLAAIRENQLIQTSVQPQSTSCRHHLKVWVPQRTVGTLP